MPRDGRFPHPVELFDFFALIRLVGIVIVDEEDVAARSHRARHLPKNLSGVFQMMKRVAADDGVGGPLRHGRVVRVRHDVAGVRIQTPFAQAFASAFGHRGSEIQPHDVPARHQKRPRGGARAHPEIDQPRACAEADALGHRSQARLFRIAVIAAVALCHSRESLDVSLFRRIHQKPPRGSSHARLSNEV